MFGSKRSIWLCVAVIAVFAIGFTRSAAQPAMAKEAAGGGSVMNGVYSNRLPWFEMRLPDGWLSMNKEQRNQAVSKGSGALKDQAGANEKEIDEGVEAETIVLQYTKKPVGSSGNSTIAVGTGRQPSGVTGKMVAESTKELFVQSSANKIVQDIKIETIGGKQFASLILDMTVSGTAVRLKYYATVVGNYSITVAMIASDDESLKAMENSLHSIKFPTK